MRVRPRVSLAPRAGRSGPSAPSADGDGEMPEFLDLLAQYYLCDATARLRPMAQDEVTACAALYEAVKAWFAPFDLAPEGTAARHAQMTGAYLGFLDWQVANAGLVAGLRAEAMAEASGSAGAGMR